VSFFVSSRSSRVNYTFGDSQNSGPFRVERGILHMGGTAFVQFEIAPCDAIRQFSE